MQREPTPSSSASTAHKPINVAQKDRSSGPSMRLQRQQQPAPANTATPTPIGPPVPGDAVYYHGTVLAPVSDGYMLTPNPEVIHELVGRLITANGQAATKSWIEG